MAAGLSRRFGDDKRRFDAGDGPLLQQTLAVVLALGLPTRVALRASDAEDIDSLLGQSAAGIVEPVYVDDSERGLGYSIARCFDPAPDWDGALLFLGDMPRLKPATAQLLITHFDASHIQAPTHGGRRGHPVLFPREFFPALATLDGDTGARDLLRNARGALIEHAVIDEGILWDLDTREH